MRIETYKCDACGKDKGEAEHWWMVSTTKGYLMIEAWKDKAAKYPARLHLCCPECVQRKVNEFLGGVK